MKTVGTDVTTLFADGSTAGALSATGALTVNGTVNVDLTAAPSSASVILLNYASTTATPCRPAISRIASISHPTPA